MGSRRDGGNSWPSKEGAGNGAVPFLGSQEDTHVALWGKLREESSVSLLT